MSVSAITGLARLNGPLRPAVAAAGRDGAGLHSGQAATSFDPRALGLSARLAGALSHIGEVGSRPAAPAMGDGDPVSVGHEWPPATSVLGDADQVARFVMSLLES